MTVLSVTELARVREQMSRTGVETGGELEAELIAGGRSNLTYRISAPGGTWVLRRPPTAGITQSAHDVAREFRVTSALSAAGVPVARPVLLCEDSSIIGSPFVVMDFVVGASVRSPADLDRLDDDRVDSLVSNLVTELAHLHDVDHVAVGLEGWARPGDYAARQVRRWARQWEVVGVDDAGPADELLGLLRDHVPNQVRTGIVHGDYRSDNALVDLERGGRVLAIVDWELSTLGDPVADVALMCVYRDPAFDLVHGSPSAWTSDRLPKPERLAEQYIAASGNALENWEYHLALAFYKVAVISAGIHHRAVKLDPTVRDSQAKEAVPRLMESGLAAMSHR